MRELRRKFLKKSGVTIAAGTPLISGVIDNKKERSLKEAGLAKECENLLKQKKHDQAEKLAKYNNIKYDRIKDHFGSISNKNTTGYGEDGRWSRSDSTYDIYAAESQRSDEGDLWQVSMGCDLVYHEYSDKTGPVDAMGVSWSDDRWAYEPGTFYSRDYGSDDNDCIEEWDVDAEGIIVNLDDYCASVPRPEDNVYEAEFYMKLEKQEQGEHNLYGHFAHTFLDEGMGSAAVDYAIETANLSAYTDNGTDKWVEDTDIIEV